MGPSFTGFCRRATAVILILAANTSFTGFPFLVSFVAEDSFLPRPLTVRGHRLVFSNGIIVLAVASIALLLATGAKVAALIPMYAIGVFTGFTMAGAGMAKHHLTPQGTRLETQRRHQCDRRRRLSVCGVDIRHHRIHPGRMGRGRGHAPAHLRAHPHQRAIPPRRRRAGRGAAAVACEAPVLQRHTAMVLVDRIDMATARAIQYARNLNPDELYAVHFDVDDRRAEAIMRRWTDLGLSRLPLEVIEVPDRRLAPGRPGAAQSGCGGRADRSERPYPDPAYRRSWSVLLHGKNADRLVRALGQIPHVNATIVPFNVADIAAAKRMLSRVRDLDAHGNGTRSPPSPGTPRCQGPHHRRAAIPPSAPRSPGESGPYGSIPASTRRPSKPR